MMVEGVGGGELVLEDDGKGGANITITAFAGGAVMTGWFTGPASPKTGF